MRALTVVLLIFVLVNLVGCGTSNNTAAILETSAESSDSYMLKVGDYVEFGRYSGQIILWRVVEINKDKPILWSEYIICNKCFDAAESAIVENGNSDVEKYGSNIWSTSNLREWLNTVGKVNWTSQPPIASAVFGSSSNNYEDENGFLTDFYAEEISMIDYTKRTEKYMNEEVIETEDKVFLPYPGETSRWEANINVFTTKTDIYGKEGLYLTQTPESESDYLIKYINGQFSESTASADTLGVVPVLQLSSNKPVSGKGTKEVPWIFTNSNTSPAFSTSEAIEGEYKETDRGNTAGNILNSGFACKYDGWIYYTCLNNKWNIYKMRSDGSEKTQINSDNSWYINVYKGWIYYQNWDDNKSIYRIRIDGSLREKLNDSLSMEINIVNGWIYYSDGDDNYKIYRMRIDGSEKEQIGDELSRDINVVNGWIYYGKYNTSGDLYLMKTDGTENQLLSTSAGYSFNVKDGWIYYSALNTKNICRMSMDGSEKQSLDNVYGSMFNISDGWIYYADKDVYNMYRISIDGGEKEQLTDYSCSYINIVDDWIYYMNDSQPNFVNMRMHTDGSYKEELK